MWKIILIILVLLYAFNPYDLLPDMMIGWGWLDDLVILGFLWRYLYKQKKKREAFQKYDQNGNHKRTSEGNNSYSYNNTRESFLEDPYRILGLTRNASDAEIKRAYRQLAAKYHPDKLEHLGDEFKDLAEKRFKEIQEAYEKLKMD